MPVQRHDLTGQRFGWLKVLRYSGAETSKTLWMCSCICGALKAIPAGELISGNAKSCGCIRRRRIWKNYGMGIAIRIGEAVNEGVISVDQADRRRIRGEAGPKWPDRFGEERRQNKGKARPVRQGDLRQKEEHQD